LNPLPQIRNHRVRQPWFFGRHFQVGVRVCHGRQQQAVVRLPRDDCRTAATADPDSIAEIQTQATLGGVCSAGMACVTMLDEHGPNFRFEQSQPRRGVGCRSLGPYRARQQ